MPSICVIKGINCLLDHFQPKWPASSVSATRLSGRPLLQPEANKLQRRYRQFRQHLFVFLYRTNGPRTNNLSERTDSLGSSIVK